MGFGRLESKTTAIVIKQRRARTQAKQNHPDMKLKHPDWCRDANQGNYTVLNKKIKEECEKAQIRNENYNKKLHKEVNNVD